MVPTVERQGNWRSAGGLPVDDRPVAGRLAGSPTRMGAGNHRNLVAIHDHLRGELEQIRRAAVDVAAGDLEPGAARDLINRMTMRQNRWTLGSFCAAYCRIVTLHHTIEDTHLFPALASDAPELTPVLDRLAAEHEVIADVLGRFDRALVLLVDESRYTGAGDNGVDGLAGLAGELADLLLSHLAYEEDELQQGLGMLTGPI